MSDQVDAIDLTEDPKIVLGRGLAAKAVLQSIWDMIDELSQEIANRKEGSESHYNPVALIEYGERRTLDEFISRLCRIEEHWDATILEAQRIDAEGCL